MSRSITAAALSWGILAVATSVVPAVAVAAQSAAPWNLADTVRAGARGYDGFTLRPGVDSTDTFMIREGQRAKLMTYVETITETPDGYLIVGENVRPDGRSFTVDSVLVARGTLAPIRHSDMTPVGRTSVRYEGDDMTGTATDTTGAESPLAMDVAAGAFDYSMARMIINLLPLRTGYAAVLLTHDIKRGGIAVPFRVVAEEQVTVSGKTAAAWKVEMNYGAFTAERWIDRATRKDLRTRVVANGREMLVEPSSAGG